MFWYLSGIFLASLLAPGPSKPRWVGPRRVAPLEHDPRDKSPSRVRVVFGSISSTKIEVSGVLAAIPQEISNKPRVKLGQTYVKAFGASQEKCNAYPHDSRACPSQIFVFQAFKIIWFKHVMIAMISTSRVSAGAKEHSSPPPLRCI